MKLQARKDGRFEVIGVSGSADAQASGLLKRALLDAIEGGSTRIICDLSDADFICSDALGALIIAYLKARGRGGCLRLANPQLNLREILETTRLNRLFEVYATVDQAVARK